MAGSIDPAAFISAASPVSAGTKAVTDTLAGLSSGGNDSSTVGDVTNRLGSATTGSFSIGGGSQGNMTLYIVAAVAALFILKDSKFFK